MRHPQATGSHRGGLARRGTSMIEVLAALALTAALGVGVAQLATMSAHIRGSVQRRSAALVAAGNALEILRATDAADLEDEVADLRGQVAGLPGATLDVVLRETTIEGIAAQEIFIRVSENPAAAPLVLVGWRLSDARGQAAEQEQAGDPSAQEGSDAS